MRALVVSLQQELHGARNPEWGAHQPCAGRVFAQRDEHPVHLLGNRLGGRVTHEASGP